MYTICTCTCNYTCIHNCKIVGDFFSVPCFLFCLFEHACTIIALYSICIYMYVYIRVYTLMRNQGKMYTCTLLRNQGKMALCVRVCSVCICTCVCCCLHVVLFVCLKSSSQRCKVHLYVDNKFMGWRKVNRCIRSQPIHLSLRPTCTCTCTCTLCTITTCKYAYIYIYIYIYIMFVLMRDEKEGRKKEASKV